MMTEKKVKLGPVGSKDGLGKIMQGFENFCSFLLLSYKNREHIYSIQPRPNLFWIASGQHEMLPYHECWSKWMLEPSEQIGSSLLLDLYYYKSASASGNSIYNQSFQLVAVNLGCIQISLLSAVTTPLVPNEFINIVDDTCKADWQVVNIRCTKSGTGDWL
ncbi:hypothetical protein RJ641_022274 [Dillenia turbinata]|uniref:Uncharacterized protein n=1 Tax=Dillenia turbinata TaxID=194707 RepID=A0AAN8UL81_9MAGN